MSFRWFVVEGQRRSDEGCAFCQLGWSARFCGWCVVTGRVYLTEAEVQEMRFALRAPSPLVQELRVHDLLERIKGGLPPVDDVAVESVTRIEVGSKQATAPTQPSKGDNRE